MEVWGEGETVEELQQAVERFPQERMAPWLTADHSLKVGHVLKHANATGECRAAGKPVPRMQQWMQRSGMVLQVMVDGWGRSVTESEQREWFQRLRFIRFQVRPTCSLVEQCIACTLSHLSMAGA